MQVRHFVQRGRVIIAVFGVALTLGEGAARAQTIPVFDEAPPLEQLRHILIPESKPGLSRSVVPQQPEQGTATQPIAVSTAQPQPTEPQKQSSPPPEGASASKLQQPIAVGFHINFAFNSAILPESAHAMIEEIAQVMKDAPDSRVRVEGHTDAAGSAAYNIVLSERRALSVAEYLVKLGIEPSRLVLIGKGMTEPLTRNPYNPTNRRVQFVRLS
jgi:outer membrane protein OmpA-like peptidoglycan-associated protein